MSMARREERYSALVGILLGLVIIGLVRFIPLKDIHSFVWRCLGGRGYPPPVIKDQMLRLSRFVFIMCLLFSGVCTYI